MSPRTSHRIPFNFVRGTKEFVTPCQKKPATDGGSISSLSNILIRLARIYYLPSIVPITHIEKNGVKGICLWSGLFEGIYVIQHCLPRYLAAEIAFEPRARIWFDRIHFNYRPRYLLWKKLRIVFNRSLIDLNSTLVEIIYHQFRTYFREFRFPTNSNKWYAIKYFSEYLYTYVYRSHRVCYLTQCQKLLIKSYRHNY